MFLHLPPAQHQGGGSVGCGVVRRSMHFLNEAIHQRYVLAATHMAYINSLKGIGNSTALFSKIGNPLLRICIHTLLLLYINPIVALRFVWCSPPLAYDESYLPQHRPPPSFAKSLPPLPSPPRASSWDLFNFFDDDGNENYCPQT
ncbi:hypothetical protein S245_051469 [Arachis hypogaea]|nr:uncharacterized protein DS421_15g495870 [Arachis hypogaea]